MNIPIYIVGAGGLGKEIWLIINEINVAKKTNYFDFKGFIDNNAALKSVKIGVKEYPVFFQPDFIAENKNNKDINITVGIGNPNIVKKIVTQLKATTAFQFPNLIHPTFITHQETFTIGEGNIIAARCTFPINITLGSHNIFNIHCTLGHDSVVGNFNIINPAANISGMVTIGDNNLIGTNATILQGLSVGDNCSVSAGSFVTKNVEDRQIVIGNPGRAIGLNQ
jgi:sugar O-acyltransferase (sialic acid O-acetyltransferase NeuD family)